MISWCFLNLAASLYALVANHTHLVLKCASKNHKKHIQRQLAAPNVIRNNIHVSPVVFLFEFCNIRIKCRILKLCASFQEVPTGNLQTCRKQWRLLLFFAELSNVVRTCGGQKGLRQCWISTCQQTISSGLHSLSSHDISSTATLVVKMDRSINAI